MIIRTVLLLVSIGYFVTAIIVVINSESDKYEEQKNFSRKTIFIADIIRMVFASLVLYGGVSGFIRCFLEASK